jgi:hypothetical protein
MKQKIKRLFTFGCSFTGYKWATWANILAYDLDCEFYNFWISGAGNTYISNTLAQADAFFNFNENDLIIVSWTNISREDRWIENQGWLTPGNIYTQSEYSQNFVDNYANSFHFALRDFTNIHFVANLLDNKSANYKFIAMCDIVNQFDQWSDKETIDFEHPLAKVGRLYKKSLDKIGNNFYDTLWNGEIRYKFDKDWKTIHHNFSDGHPTPIEHYEFIKKALNYSFEKSTKNRVKKLQADWRDFIRSSYKNTNRACGIHELDPCVEIQLRSDFILRNSDEIPTHLFH